MKLSQFSLLPTPSRPNIPSDVIAPIKDALVPIAQTASDMTLSMTYLDPDHTRAQTIGTYLRDNLTSRLEADYVNHSAPDLRAISKGHQFKLRIDSSNGVTYSFPIHRCGNDYVPKGGRKLKLELSAQSHQHSFTTPPPLGLFIGITYHEERGIIEIFIGQLQLTERKNKYQTAIIDMLFSKPNTTIDPSRLLKHDVEDIPEPVVRFKKR